MTQEIIIEKTKRYVKDTLSKDASGHDWWHVYRVWKLAMYLAKEENANEYIVALAALLHDIADWKFNNGDLTAGPKVAREWLMSLNVDDTIISSVCNIIETISFKGANVHCDLKSLEAKVVQDADRLDAIGAIGIGRTFAYGGHQGRAMYEPNISPDQHHTFEDYKNSEGTTVNHFYEKLLLLKDRMNTRAGKQIAEKRHQLMVNYLEEFMNEWYADY